MIVSRLRRGLCTFRGALKRNYSTGKTPRTFPVWKSASVLVLTSAALWLYYRSERAAIEQKRKMDAPSSAGTPAIGGPFKLLDTDGRVFSDTDLLGRHYLIYFGFTHCPDICPEELDKMSRISRLVKERNSEMPLVPVFITCDPERDTPEKIKAYLKDFDADFIGLTGSPDAIKALARSYRFYYRPTHTSASGDYLVDHSTFFYLIGPDGQFITNFGRNSSAEECAAYISGLAAQGK